MTVTGKGVSLLVASNDASAGVKAKADYTCDGTDDDVQIAAALAALPSDGGVVSLTEGDFNLTSKITFPSSTPCALVGHNEHHWTTQRGITRLNFDFTSAGDCIEFANDTWPQRLEGVEMYGDDTYTEHGVYIGGSAAFKALHNVTIHDMTEHFVYGASGSSQCRFDRVYVHDIPSGKAGFSLYTVAMMMIQCQASRPDASGVGGLAGFRLASTHATLVGCIAENMTIGFLIAAYSVDVHLYGCYGEGNDQHIQISGSAPNEPKGTLISGFYGTQADVASADAIDIRTSEGTTLVGCVIEDSDANRAIGLTSNADGVTIIGGWTNDTTPLTDGGASKVVVEGFYPFISENKGTGTITSGNTSVAVTHGLSATPSLEDIQIVLGEQGTNDPGNVWVDTIGATTFTVNCRNDPGASGLDFGWHAKVY
jgi:hypothetical protein